MVPSTINQKGTQPRFEPKCRCSNLKDVNYFLFNATLHLIANQKSLFFSMIFASFAFCIHWHFLLWHFPICFAHSKWLLQIYLCQLKLITVLATLLTRYCFSYAKILRFRVFKHSLLGVTFLSYCFFFIFRLISTSIRTWSTSQTLKLTDGTVTILSGKF